MFIDQLGCGGARVHDLGAERGQSTLDACAYVGHDGCLGECESFVSISTTRVEHDHLACDSGAQLLQCLSLSNQDSVAVAHRAGEAFECPVGGEATCPV